MAYLTLQGAGRIVRRGFHGAGFGPGFLAERREPFALSLRGCALGDAAGLVGGCLLLFCLNLSLGIRSYRRRGPGSRLS